MGPLGQIKMVAPKHDFLAVRQQRPTGTLDMDEDQSMSTVADTDGSAGTDYIEPEWLSVPPKSGLPIGFRLLCVAPQEPSWIALGLRLDSVGCHDAKIHWVSTPGEAMSYLRREAVDAILLEYQHHNHQDEWDIIHLLNAIRASGCEDPVIVLASRPSDFLASASCEANADMLISAARWDSKALLPFLQRAIRQCELRRENHHLAVANHRRLVRERDEADHLLQQQRDIVRELELLTGQLDEDGHARVFDAEGLIASGDDGGSAANLVPDEIKTYYQELLRTYVIVGTGNLGAEIATLAQVLAQLGLSPRNTLSLHLERVEELVKGLGNRSTRHVMARADLLVLEIIMHLGECYQNRARQELENWPAGIEII